MKWTRVAAAVVMRGSDEVLLAQRPAGKAYAGYWEFPGGKLEPGESARDALVREMHEELGLDIARADPWLVSRYVYPHASVELAFFRVPPSGWRGEPVGHDGQAFAWQRVGAFDVSPLLPANSGVMRALALPTVLGITCAAAMGEPRYLALAERAFDRGLRLVQVREKSMSFEGLSALLAALRARAGDRPVRFVVNGTPDLALRLRADGVHLPATLLESTRARPDLPLCGASCHDRRELDRAIELGLDYALLGPVRSTPTHPGHPGIGWDAFAAIAQPTPIPVFALGGMTLADLDAASSHGAHGVAMIRGAWGD